MKKSREGKGCRISVRAKRCRMRVVPRLGWPSPRTGPVPSWVVTVHRRPIQVVRGRGVSPFFSLLLLCLLSSSLFRYAGSSAAAT